MFSTYDCHTLIFFVSVKYYALFAPLPPKYDPSEYWKPQKTFWSNSLEDTELHFKQKWAWPFSGVSQRIEVLAHIPCCSLGSNYPKTVELPSTKLSAHKLYYRSSKKGIGSMRVVQSIDRSREY